MEIDRAFNRMTTKLGTADLRGESKTAANIRLKEINLFWALFG